MVDQPAPGRIIDGQNRTGQPPAAETPQPKTTTYRVSLAGIDLPILGVVGLLLAVGSLMVYSTTFDWAYQDFGGNPAAVVTIHLRNMAISGVVALLLVAIDYRIWKRFAIVLLLVSISLLIAVLLFGDNTFGARRAFVQGSYQPGEVAELVTIIYMAAWLGSKKARVGSLMYGLLPFAVLVGVLAGLVMLQPDISTAAMIVLVAGVMFFLAGADLLQIAGAGVIVTVLGMIVLATRPLGYAQERVESYLSGIQDLTQANYHVQQAIIAFINGGWTGVGLGEGRQKFGSLPAPHTDSIFAVIGEELGVIGAGLVVLLYVVLVMRGLRVSWQTRDSFGALLAAGITIWIAAKALLNIAVMIAILPATGAPLPLISYGGSSMLVLLSGVGLLLSVSRITAQQQVPERKQNVATTNPDRRRGDGRTRLPGTRHRRSTER